MQRHLPASSGTNFPLTTDITVRVSTTQAFSIRIILFQILVAVALASPAFAIPVYPVIESALVPGFASLSYAGTMEPYPYPIGHQGIGFDRRTAQATGFRNPLTPKMLEVLWEDRPEKRGRA